MKSFKEKVHDVIIDTLVRLGILEYYGINDKELLLAVVKRDSHSEDIKDLRLQMELLAKTLGYQKYWTGGETYEFRKIK